MTTTNSCFDKLNSMKKQSNLRKSRGKFPAVPGNPDPKSGEWNERYAMTSHWQSDLNFYFDEMRFLNRVINKFFIWLSEEENVKMTRVMVNRITASEGQRNKLDQRMASHMQHIREILQNPFPYDDSVSRDEHMRLEEAFAVFVKNFRALKREVFALTEHVLETEDEANQFLGS